MSKLVILFFVTQVLYAVIAFGETGAVTYQAYKMNNKESKSAPLRCPAGTLIQFEHHAAEEITFCTKTVDGRVTSVKHGPYLRVTRMSSSDPYPSEVEQSYYKDGKMDQFSIKSFYKAKNGKMVAREIIQGGKQVAQVVTELNQATKEMDVVLSANFLEVQSSLVEDKRLSEFGSNYETVGVSGPVGSQRYSLPSASLFQR